MDIDTAFYNIAALEPQKSHDDSLSMVDLGAAAADPLILNESPAPRCRRGGAVRISGRAGAVGPAAASFAIEFTPVAGRRYALVANSCECRALAVGGEGEGNLIELTPYHHVIGLGYSARSCRKNDTYPSWPWNGRFLFPVATAAPRCGFSRSIRQLCDFYATLVPNLDDSGLPGAYFRLN
uniref:Uncharacterized protein n=1 Tax=Mycena chlorophos TaxID=658473 RepID=A0ABQ0LLT0_MYCCL|nr:predicted protein [Mycena chlorophos]